MTVFLRLMGMHFDAISKLMNVLILLRIWIKCEIRLVWAHYLRCCSLHSKSGEYVGQEINPIEDKIS